MHNKLQLGMVHFLISIIMHAFSENLKYQQNKTKQKDDEVMQFHSQYNLDISKRTKYEYIRWQSVLDFPI